MEFGKFLANTIVTKVLIYAAATNKVVYVQGAGDTGMPFVVDSANANLLLIWGGKCTTNCSTAAGHMLVGHFGYSGAAATTLPRWVAVNALYPQAALASPATAPLVVRDASGAVRVAAGRTNSTAFYNPTTKAWTYWSLSRGALTALPYAAASMAGYTVTLTAPSKTATVTATVPSPFSVRPGSVVWVIFAQTLGAPVIYQTALPPSGCVGTPSTIADGRCDAANNSPKCLYDGGDCCPATCPSSATYACGSAGYVCLAAAHPAAPPTPPPTPAAGAPTATPTTPTFASVLSVQPIAGVTQSDVISANFPVAVQQAVASALGVSVSQVSIPSVAYVPSRGRARGLLAAGAAATYRVTVPNTDPQSLAAAVAANAASMTTFLRALGYPSAAAATPTVTSTTPTGSPVAPPPPVLYTVPGTATTNGAQAGACFAADEHVTLEDGATKAISAVAVGDRILTVNAQGKQVYSDVVVVPHGRNAVRATFVMITTEAGRDLKLTTNHVLPAGACVCTALSLPVVAASAVTVGDCVQTVSGRERVLSVTQVEGEGIYTAIAMEELLVVNGIVATPYGGVNPALANVYYNLHRLVYRAAGRSPMSLQRSLQTAAASFWTHLF